MPDALRLKIALAYFEAGNLAEAEAECKAILRVEPEDPVAREILEMINAGPVQADLSKALAFISAGRYHDAIWLLEKLHADHPHDAQILCALGSAHFHLDHYNRSQDYLEQALALEPDFAEAHAVLGNCRINQADIYGAMEAFERSHQMSPFNTAVYSSYLFYMAFHPDYDGERLNRENRAWGKSYEAGFDPFTHPAPGRERPDRLRIGYLSYEYSTHVTSFYFEPLASRHDPNRFETFCYAGNEEKDRTTDRLAEIVDHWIDISSIDAKSAAQRIFDDGIDILVSTSSYLAKHRLPLVYRPAPIQVCYQNRASTMGFNTVDYLVTEELADPTGEAEELYLEKLVRLTHRGCYSAPPDSPDPGQVPVLENGYVTFGSFNNTAKITPQAASAWADILTEVDGSRLLIKNIVHSDDDSDWNPLRELLRNNGVDLTRVDFLPYFKGRNDHLAAYRRMDIMLDTFPFNGGATCCDALWMGVPVVALVGKTFCYGQAREYLTKLGLPEFITEDVRSYKRAAVNLAGDLNRMADLRQTIRPMMIKNMLDYDLHVEEMMAAYDHMWTLYTAGDPPEAFNVKGRQVSRSPVNASSAG